MHCGLPLSTEPTPKAFAGVTDLAFGILKGMGLSAELNLNDAKIPPFGKGGKGGIFLESLGKKSPPPPLIKGGPNVTSGGFLQECRNAF